MVKPICHVAEVLMIIVEVFQKEHDQLFANACERPTSHQVSDLRRIASKLLPRRFG